MYVFEGDRNCSRDLIVVTTHIRLEEVRPRLEIRNVERDLEPGFGSLDLGSVLGLVQAEEDLAGAELGGEGALGGTTGGLVGDLQE